MTEISKKHHDQRHIRTLPESLDGLTEILREHLNQKLVEWEWNRSRSALITADDLHKEISRLEKLMAKNQTEITADVKAATEQLKKIGVETGRTLQKVTDLEAIIAAGNGGEVTPELETAVAELKAQAQATDDLVPDVAPPTA